MAVGQPRLVTYYPDGTLRVYEYSEAGFVQLSSRGTYPHDPGTHPDGVVFTPRVTYFQDGELIALQYSPSNTDHREVNFDADLVPIGTSQNMAQGNTDAALGPTVYVPIDRLSMILPVAGYFRMLNTLVTTPGTMVGRIPYGPTDSKIRGIWLSPNGEGIVIGNAISTQNLCGWRYQYMSVGAGSFPDYSFDTASINSSKPITAGVWLDNDSFIGVSSTGSGIFQWDDVNHDLILIAEFSTSAGDPVHAVCAPQAGRWIALSFLSGGVYTTDIFERVGSFPVFRQTISGIGKTIGFSQDGSLLIDASAKKAYTVDAFSVWNEVSGALTNVVSGAIVQGISPHIKDPVGFTSLYDNRLADLHDNLINLDDLYLTLMTPDAAPFDPTDSTISAVLGTEEVTDGLWPAGGIHLLNATSVAVGARQWKIDVDDLTYIIKETGIVFSYAVVYEHSTGKPLLHIDFLREYTVPHNTEIQIKFNAAGLLVYTG